MSALPDPISEEQPRRPVLRWHGGKWRLARWVQQYFPPHRFYCEPYCGAASVILQKPRAYAEYLNDLDNDLINLFRVLQNKNQAQELIRLITLTPFARAEFELAYEVTDDHVERARRLCIRSFMGFSSASGNIEHKTGFRSRSFRNNTGPAMDWRNYPDSLLCVVSRLRGVTIESRPAIEVIRRLDTPETLFYVDPPYIASTRNNYGAYRYEMTDSDHEELSTTLKQCKGYVLLSGYQCSLYNTLYSDWIKVERQATSDHGWRTECLWLSPRTVKALKKNARMEQINLLNNI